MFFAFKNCGHFVHCLVKISIPFNPLCVLLLFAERCQSTVFYNGSFFFGGGGGGSEVGDAVGGGVTPPTSK